jgi:hypothetical protein
MKNKFNKIKILKVKNKRSHPNYQLKILIHFNSMKNKKKNNLYFYNNKVIKKV